MVWNIFPFICASTIFVIPKISWISARVWYVKLIFELLLIGILINKGMRWFYVVTYLSHSWCQTPTCDMETGNACFEYFILLKKNSCNFGKNEIWKRNPCQDKTCWLGIFGKVLQIDVTLLREVMEKTLNFIVGIQRWIDREFKCIFMTLKVCTSKYAIISKYRIYKDSFGAKILRDDSGLSMSFVFVTNLCKRRHFERLQESKSIYFF